jgi:hypothetical protein
LKEGSRLPRSKGYKKQEALDGGYLNVRLSADLSAKLDRDCADYARRAEKPRNPPSGRDCCASSAAAPLPCPLGSAEMEG